MPTVLTTDPETGELGDPRDLPQTVLSLLRRDHPELGEVFDLGDLRAPSGCIAITDPVEHLHKQPLARRAPRGEHAVSLLRARDGELGAVVVSFGPGEVASVERVAWVWPFADARRFAVESGLVALFDYDRVGGLDPIQSSRFAALAALGPDRPAAIVALPRVRWNAIVCRPPPSGNHFYSAHWALGPRDEPLALVVDFAVFP